MKAPPTSILFLTSIILLGSVNASLAQEPVQPRIMEAYPHHIETLLRRDTLAQEDLPFIPESVLHNLKLWAPGQVLSVAFIGGSPELHERIAKTATEWAQYGNIALDFGYSPDPGTYRMVTSDDQSHIRVSFDYKGYWSVVGRDSHIIPAGTATMNLAQFDIDPPAEPLFTQVVLHEFGHALGFLHEHQNPDGGCDAEFHWERIYEYLSRPPNGWSTKKVDRNLRQLPNSWIYGFSEHDSLSVMHYAFDPWMFIQGEKSRCYIGENTTLSEGDKLGINRAYSAFAEERIDDQTQSVLDVLGNVDIGSASRLVLQAKLESLQAAVQNQPFE